MLLWVCQPSRPANIEPSVRQKEAVITAVNWQGQSSLRKTWWQREERACFLLAVTPREWSAMPGFLSHTYQPDKSIHLPRSRVSRDREKLGMYLGITPSIRKPRGETVLSEIGTHSRIWSRVGRSLIYILSAPPPAQCSGETRLDGREGLWELTWGEVWTFPFLDSGNYPALRQHTVPFWLPSNLSLPLLTCSFTKLFKLPTLGMPSVSCLGPDIEILWLWLLCGKKIIRRCRGEVRGGGGKFKSRPVGSGLWQFREMVVVCIRVPTTEVVRGGWSQDLMWRQSQQDLLMHWIWDVTENKCQKRLFILQLWNRMVLFRGLTGRELAVVFLEVGGYPLRICKIALASIFLLVFSSQNCNS